MAHHGEDYPTEMKEQLAKLFLEQEKVSGTFPEGKLNKSDEGALAMQVGADNGKVIIQFGEPTAWIGFTPEQAVGLAEILIQKAKDAGLRSIISITL